MPRCDGRPDEACPGKVHDNSVKFTQGDLFLFPDCEEFRFPQSTLKSTMKVGTRKGSMKKAEAAQTQADGKSRPQTSQLNNSLCCDTCRGLFLCEPLGIDEAAFKHFASIANIFGWVCAACRDVVRNQLRQFKLDQNSIQDTVEQLKVDLNQTKQEFSCLKTSLVSTSQVPDDVNWPRFGSIKRREETVACYRPLRS